MKRIATLVGLAGLVVGALLAGSGSRGLVLSGQQPHPANPNTAHLRAETLVGRAGLETATGGL